jgi:hypothetical protein
MSLISASRDALVVSTSGVKTLLELRQAASRSLTLKQWSIEFDGVTASNVPVQVQLVTTSGTASTGTAGIQPQVMRDLQPAVSASCVDTVTVENTTVVIIEQHRVPPTSGLLIQYPLGEEPYKVGAASNTNALGVRALAGAAVNAAVTMEAEE